jgi:chromosome segregation ATPase
VSEEPRCEGCGAAAVIMFHPSDDYSWGVCIECASRSASEYAGGVTADRLAQGLCGAALAQGMLEEQSSFYFERWIESLKKVSRLNAWLERMHTEVVEACVQEERSRAKVEALDAAAKLARELEARWLKRANELGDEVARLKAELEERADASIQLAVERTEVKRLRAELEEAREDAGAADALHADALSRVRDLDSALRSLVCERAKLQEDLMSAIRERDEARSGKQTNQEGDVCAHDAPFIREDDD